ncbi:MAG: hypothetical protein JOZ69_18485 [Myxococcales bacterium]|nr:hypothetical protein [Myxococcales bacterium]
MTKKTPREHFGTALASLAYLYRTAEARGDFAHAQRYSAAVDLLLGAWPAESTPTPDFEMVTQINASFAANEAVPAAPDARAVWPSQEPTLVGLGVVQ